MPSSEPSGKSLKRRLNCSGIFLRDASHRRRSHPFDASRLITDEAGAGLLR
jgi:hypothetical protein